MSNSITCYQCQATLRYGAPPEKPRKAKCPRCGTELTIPAGQESRASVPDPLATPPRARSNPQIVPDEAAIVTPNAVPRTAPHTSPDAFQPPRYPAGAEPRRSSRDEDDPRPRRERDRDDRDRGDRDRERQRDRDDRPDRRSRDDGYRDERPRRSARRRGKGLIIGLSLGIGGLVVVGLVLILVFTLGGAGNPLVGKWRPDVGIDLGIDTGTIEFTSSGNILVSGPFKGGTVRYRVIDSQSFEVEELDGGFGGFGGPFGGGGGGGRGRKEITYFRIEGDVLSLGDRPGAAMLRLRRVR